MASGGADITFHGNTDSLIKSQDAAIRKMEAMIAKLKESGKESKVAMTEMDRFAASTMKLNQTPVERYKEQMFKLNTALRAGKIDQESFNRAVAAASTELREAGKAGQEAFGPKMLANLAAATAAVAPLKLAFEGWANAIRESQQELAAIGDKFKTDVAPMGELAQMANTPKEMATYTKEAKEIYRSGATRTLGEAAQLENTILSAGMQRYRAQIAELQAAGVVLDMKKMVEAAAALEASLGFKETGGFAPLVSKSFGAGFDAPGRAEEYLLEASLLGGPAKELGLGEEDLLAGLATIAKETGSPAEAGTQFKGLLVGLAKAVKAGELQRQASLPAYVGYLRSIDEQGGDIREVIGDRQEGMSAFATLRDAPERFAANRGYVVQAEKDDLFRQKTNLYKAVPELVAARELRQREAEKQLALNDQAATKLMADALQADLQSQMIGEGLGPVRRYIKNQVLEARRGRGWLSLGAMGGGSDEAFIESFTPFASPDMKAGLQDFRAAAGEIRAAAVELRAGGQVNADANLTNAARANQAAAGGAVEAR